MSTAYEQLFACDCAERVVHLCDDDCTRDALAVARRYAWGQASPEELVVAINGADIATYATSGNRAAARAIAYAAGAVGTEDQAADYIAAHTTRAARRGRYEDAARACACAIYAVGPGQRAAEREWQAARLEWYAQGHRPDGPEYSIQGWILEVPE